MRRGELYRVRRPGGDPKRSRVFVVVSRDALVQSAWSTVICAPVYTSRHGISTEVGVGPEVGLKHDSAIACDGLVSLPKAALSDYVGALGPGGLAALDSALGVALGLDQTGS